MVGEGGVSEFDSLASKRSDSSLPVKPKCTSAAAKRRRRRKKEDEKAEKDKKEAEDRGSPSCPHSPLLGVRGPGREPPPPQNPEGLREGSQRIKAQGSQRKRQSRTK